MDKEAKQVFENKISSLSPEEHAKRDKYLRQISIGKILGPTTGYASIDKPWLKFYNEEHLDIKLPEVSMYQYLINNVQNYLDLTAVDLRMGLNNFNHSIKTLTYKEFLEEVTTIACGFKSLGINPNEIVMELLPNLLESRESIYAVNAIGATVYPLQPVIPTFKVEEIIKLNNIKNVVVFGGFYQKFKDALADKSIEHIIYLTGTESFNPILRKLATLKDKEGNFQIPNDDRIITWDKIISSGKKYRKANKIKNYKDLDLYHDKNHIAAIVGTSGTTGIPKGACLTDYAINASDFSEQVPRPFEPGETNVDILIQSISYGIGIMHHTMSGGLKNIVVPELISDKTGLLLKKFKAKNFAGGPIHYENILKSEEYKNHEIPEPKNFLSGGASLSEKTEKSLNGNVDENYVEPTIGDTKVFVRQGLGATENSGTGIFTTRGTYKYRSVGIPIAYSNCSIFKYGTDEEFTTGEVGEICMSGPTMMTEYINNEAETKKVLLTHSDGTKWLHLGDKGYMDQEGHVFMLDRYKDIFMRQGFNVHPTKIADAIKKSDKVVDCAVIGIEHPIEMYVPVAFVVVRDGYTIEEIEQELNDICYNNLEEYYIPYQYQAVTSIPRNIGGKVQSSELIEKYNIKFDDNSLKKIKKR